MQAPGVNPVIRAAQRVFAPARVVVWRQPCPLEIIQAVHGEDEPFFALPHQAIKQFNGRDIVVLKAPHGIQLSSRGLELCFLFVVLLQFAAQRGNLCIQVLRDLLDIPGDITIGDLLHGLQRNAFIKLCDCGCRIHLRPSLLVLLAPALPPTLH
jgi:hypothetical protein